jgi:hypothetical protein
VKLFSANMKLIWSPLWVRLPKPLLGLLSPRCQGCEGSMVQLGEEETQSFLDDGQRCESVVGSVRYILWQCRQCDAVVPQARKRRSAYRPCPNCGYRACKTQVVTLAWPTQYSPGQRLVKQDCAYCHYHAGRHEEVARVLTPRSMHRPSAGDFDSRAR